MKIQIDRDFFEHLLNCLANQRSIHQMSQQDAQTCQACIDEAWLKGVEILHDAKIVKPPLGALTRDQWNRMYPEAYTGNRVFHLLNALHSHAEMGMAANAEWTKELKELLEKK